MRQFRFSTVGVKSRFDAVFDVADGVDVDVVVAAEIASSVSASSLSMSEMSSTSSSSSLSSSASKMSEVTKLIFFGLKSVLTSWPTLFDRVSKILF